ncbi:MAG TPA: bifunctional serine/threonine-protein kinase/formylglycine-generating enzyme family protein [Planctomycetaceae bacterium]|nr:bifunctional serine/threonine-protein kinase/formylglycine-generating enzyme family protein [Planctomycetaceae bacterium]
MALTDPYHWTDQKLAGRYLVREKLGSGGMGTVYLARDLKLDADVVIKAPHPVMIKDAAFAARFRQEIRSLVELSHPHVVKVMDVDEHEGLPFAVLQYLSGGSLEDRLFDADGRPRVLEPAEVLGWIEDVAEALDYIHARGYVHRDIKPANLLFDEHGRVYLGDFGIAKAVAATGTSGDTGLTGTGMAIGTAEYMAPETLLKESAGKPYDGRVDQYALGVTVYECLCGRRPYSGPNVAIVAVAMATTRAPMPHQIQPEIPELVSKAVAKSLLKDPEKRYANCQTFARTLLKAVRSATGAANLTTARSGSATRVPAARERSSGSGSDRGSRVGPPPLPPKQPAPEPAADAGSGEAFPALIDTGPTRGRTIGSHPADTVQIQLTRRQVRIAAGIGAGLLGVVLLVLLVRSGGGPEATSAGLRAGGGTAATGETAPGGVTAAGGDVPQAQAAQGDAASNGSARDAVTNSIGMTLVRIPAGEFLMGSPGSERLAQDQEKPQHRVQIPKAFYLGGHEVTQGEYRVVMGTNPSHFRPGGAGGAKLSGAEVNDDSVKQARLRQLTQQASADFATSDFPVETVSWSDAVEFCRRLSSRPEERAAGRSYRLPTEAEWEYACRAGTTASRYSGDDPAALGGHARFRDNAAGRTAPVGSRPPNPWGLYDMYGNVWEWCSDFYARDYYRASPTYNPQGPTTGTSRVLRGGSWWDDAPFCRSANRDFYLPTYRDYEVGFRVVCEIASP